jgi:hypothetical protein
MADDHTTGSCMVTFTLHPIVRPLALIPTEPVYTDDLGCDCYRPHKRQDRADAAYPRHHARIILLTIQLSVQ